MRDRDTTVSRDVREWYFNGAEGIYREGEEIIARYSDWSYWYACNKLKGRFRMGESVIASNGQWSYYYAANILEGRFELGEKEIKITSYWDLYTRLLKRKGIKI